MAEQLATPQIEETTSDPLGVASVIVSGIGLMGWAIVFQSSLSEAAGSIGSINIDGLVEAASTLFEIAFAVFFFMTRYLPGAGRPA